MADSEGAGEGPSLMDEGLDLLLGRAADSGGGANGGGADGGGDDGDGGAPLAPGAGVEYPIDLDAEPPSAVSGAAPQLPADPNRKRRWEALEGDPDTFPFLPCAGKKADWWEYIRCVLARHLGPPEGESSDDSETDSESGSDNEERCSSAADAFV